MMSKTCFVISPIGPLDSEERRRSDQVLKHIISPAVSERGYQAIRADQIAEPGMITSQVIQHIVDDPLVVADLTGRNANVFYELALRHALRKPLVQLIKKGEQIPFDVAAMRTIEVDHHDLDSVEDARKEIVKQIDAAEKTGARLETPISVALDLQALRQSDDPERRSLADIVSTLSDIQSSMAKIETRVNESRGLIYLLYEAESRRGIPMHLQLKSTADPRLEQFSYSYDEALRRILDMYKGMPETSPAPPPEEDNK